MSEKSWELRFMVLHQCERWDEAFSVLHANLHGSVGALIRRRRSNVDDHDDLTQAVWMRVHHSLPTFRRNGSPQAWVRRIALTTVNDFFRKRRDTLVDALDSQLVSGGPLGSALGLKPPTSPSSHAARSELKQALSVFLESLEPEDQQLFRARYVEGLKIMKIAARDGRACAHPETECRRLAKRILRLVDRLRNEFKARGLV